MKAENLVEENRERSLTDFIGGYLTRRRAAVVMFVLCIMLIVGVVAALAIGSEHISLSQVFAALLAKLTGRPLPVSPQQEAIIFSLRLPRIVMALGVGATLAVAGASFQALLRNPLADPYVLGVSGGAALGTILAIMFVAEATYTRPLFGFCGAGFAALAVYRMGKRNDDPANLVLAGIIMSTFLSSVIVLLTAIADNVKLRNITFWLLGDLSSANGANDLGLIFIWVAGLIGIAFLISQSRALNLMMIGERDAFALGVETARVRWIVYLTASLMTGVAVSVGGAIGYVGLVTPHLVRLSAGADNRLVIPASALGGSLIVLIADTVARTVLAPRELPTGAITALIGAPVFVYLLMRGRRDRETR